MIVLEILGQLIAQILVEGILKGSFRLMRKGAWRIKALVTGVKGPVPQIESLERKYLYKKIRLTVDLNPKLVSGKQGVILEVINENKVFAEFYDELGNQIEFGNDSVFEVGMKHFRLIRQR